MYVYLIDILYVIKCIHVKYLIKWISISFISLNHIKVSIDNFIQKERKKKGGIYKHVYSGTYAENQICKQCRKSRVLAGSKYSNIYVFL